MRVQLHAAFFFINTIISNAISSPRPTISTISRVSSTINQASITSSNAPSATRSAIVDGLNSLPKCIWKYNNGTLCTSSPTGDTAPRESIISQCNFCALRIHNSQAKLNDCLLKIQGGDRNPALPINIFGPNCSISSSSFTRSESSMLLNTPRTNVMLTTSNVHTSTAHAIPTFGIPAPSVSTLQRSSTVIIPSSAAIPSPQSDSGSSGSQGLPPWMIMIGALAATGLVASIILAAMYYTRRHGLLKNEKKLAYTRGNDSTADFNPLYVEN